MSFSLKRCPLSKKSGSLDLVILTGVGMFRTTVSIEWTTFDQHFQYDPNIRFLESGIMSEVWMFRTTFSIFTMHLAIKYVSFPIKMTPIHKVWLESARSWMFRTTSSIVWTTFAKALGSQKCHFPDQNNPYPQSLELESRTTGGHE